VLKSSAGQNKKRSCSVLSYRLKTKKKRGEKSIEGRSLKKQKERLVKGGKSQSVENDKVASPSSNTLSVGQQGNLRERKEKKDMFWHNRSASSVYLKKGGSCQPRKCPRERAPVKTQQQPSLFSFVGTPHCASCGPKKRELGKEENGRGGLRKTFGTSKGKKSWHWNNRVRCVSKNLSP